VVGTLPIADVQDSAAWGVAPSQQPNKTRHSRNAEEGLFHGEGREYLGRIRQSDSEHDSMDEGKKKQIQTQKASLKKRSILPNAKA